MPTKTIALRHSLILFAFLLIVWGVYRRLFELPEEIDELFIKPAVWLTPLLLLLAKEKLGLKSVGFRLENLFPAVYYAIALGAVFTIEGLLVNYFKYAGALNFNAQLGERAFILTLGLSLATAIPEELVFRGFIFNRVWHAISKEWTANIIVSIGWVIIHIPGVLLSGDSLSVGLLYLLLTFLYSLGAGFVFARTKNVVAPILLHVLWEWPIILFR